MKRDMTGATRENIICCWEIRVRTKQFCVKLFMKMCAKKNKKLKDSLTIE